MLPELPGEELKRSKLKNKRKGGIQPNAWTLEGVIEVAFSQLGMTSQRTEARIHMGQTRRVSDALFAVSQAYTQHTSVASLELKRSICAARIVCIWFLLEDAHDCTPVKVNFGNLRRDLAPHARYWHNEKIEGCADVKWRLLSAEDFRTVSRKEFPPSGIVELLAHLQRISWPKETRGFMGVESKRARLRPCYLQRGNGSTIYAALARDHTFITFEDLCSMAHEIPFVLWNVNSDLASSCQRGKMEKARQARMHNDRALEPESTIGVIMFISGECVGHIFHREIEKEFETQRLIPRLYDAAWCVTLPGMYSSMVQAFDRIVSGDWEFGFFPHVQPPDPAWERHRKALVDLTLRRSLLTRAEQEDDHLTGSLESLADEWQDFFNGDPRQPFLSHFCFKPGCCGGQDKEVSKARCRRLLQYALLFGVGKSLPSTTRWYTFSPHLASQALGLFTNKVYTRAQEMTHQARIELPTSQTHAHSLRHACQRTHITYHILLHSMHPQAVAISDENDFHAVSNKKKVQVMEVCANLPQHAETLALSLLTTFPLDHLSYRLQRLDFAGGSMLELTSSQHYGSLPKCLRTCWELANTWYESPHATFLPALEWLLEALGVTPSVFRARALGKIVAVAAAAWCRLVLYLGFPWCLLSAHLLPEHLQNQMWNEFLNLPSCCLDAWWGEPFLTKLLLLAADTNRNVRDVIEQVKPALLYLSRKLRATNMALEGELSEIRCAAPSQRGHGPMAAEKLIYCGHLQA